MVLGLCRLLLRDHHEAEDAAQQTFVSAYRSLLRGTEPREPGPWLAAIARNECRARLRRRAKAPLALDGELELELADTSDLAELADQREELAQLASEIAKLPTRQREALALRDFLGLSYEEVASTLSVSVPVVESLLFRARRRLRDTVRTVPRYAAGLVVVPLALRASVARDVPDFDSIGVGLGLAGVAGAAAGGVAKVLSIPASVKIAATVAVVATGSVVAPKLVAPTHHAAAPAAVVRVAEPDAGAGAGSSERSVDPPEPASEQQAPAAEPAASSSGGGGTSASSAPEAVSAPPGKADEAPAPDADPGRINSGIPGAAPEVVLPTVECVPALEEPAVTTAEEGQEPAGLGSRGGRGKHRRRSGAGLPGRSRRAGGLRRAGACGRAGRPVARWKRARPRAAGRAGRRPDRSRHDRTAARHGCRKPVRHSARRHPVAHHGRHDRLLDHGRSRPVEPRPPASPGHSRPLAVCSLTLIGPMASTGSRSLASVSPRPGARHA